MSVTLVTIIEHPIAQKYLERSGLNHAISVAEQALTLATQRGLDADTATKAALLHDIGHYEWYTDGTWNYDLYRQNDIHAIKGAERAHKLLIRLGEEPERAKEIALAVLLHTDSYLPPGTINRTPLQQLVHDADTLEEQPGGLHHYEKIPFEEAVNRLHALDSVVHRFNNLPRIASEN
ncbi:MULTISPECIES: HD domain-containing protein [Exiguobacterium]|uniref:HD domain-containing protein n=1 Tax=Exiguobacterium TaxID=33986 RepID=UPI001BE58B8A|nr:MULTISPECIES: HD domain-containing protein [Exiguobacterium]MCT4792309.1 HD domain-containing protein [Exiguobacterium artemiae]MDW2883998.1 HD domain-containing protein [Exiguobacterium sibiricum]MDX1258412.1 HD domain-containing protein [Exiguobacterium sp. K1]